MAQPRPSCTLILDIDEALATEETKLEVGRCYSYVGSALVRPHAAEDTPRCRMRLMAKLGNRKYLHSADEGADELWGDVMEQWMYNQFHTVSNNMCIYNRRQREIGGIELPFKWLDVELENGALTVSVALDSNCSVPPEQASLITDVRRAFNDGALGENVVRVIAPTQASFDEQKAAAEVAKAHRIAQEQAEAAAKAEAEAAAKAQAEAEAAQEFLESPAAANAEAEALAAEEEAARAALEEKYGIDDPDFAVDFTLWTVVRVDGTQSTFDSSTGTFVE